MTEPRKREGAHYLGDDEANTEIAPEQQFAEPRPGYGTVYFHKGRNNERQIVWVADWVDEFPSPDATGATVGTASIEGDLQFVFTWARSRPAATFLMASESETPWIPLPPTADTIT